MKFSISPYQSINYFAVCELIDADFGLGYSKSKQLEGVSCKGFCAFIGSELVGFSLLSFSDNKGVLELIVVKKGMRNNGIGRELFQARVDYALEKGISNLRLNHWVKKTNPKPKMAIEIGFHFVGRIDNYWHADSLELDFSCVECEKMPCKCTCDQYELELLG